MNLNNVFDFFGFGLFYGITVRHLLVLWIACAVIALILTRRENPGILGSALIMALGPIVLAVVLYESIESRMFRFSFRTIFDVVTDAERQHKRQKVEAVLASMAEAVVVAQSAIDEQRRTDNGSVKREQRSLHRKAKKNLETAVKLATRDGISARSYETLVVEAEIRIHNRSAQESNVTPYRKAG